MKPEKQKIYHFTIFSRLLSHGGGRETWLDIFLPELKRVEEDAIVNVYYFKDALSIDEDTLNVVNDERFQFYCFNLPYKQSKLYSLYRILKFSICINQVIKSKTKQKGLHYIIAVGSYPEAFSLVFIKAFSKSKHILYLAWLRTILEKQIGTSWKLPLIKSFIIKVEHYILKKMNMNITNGWDTGKYYSRNNIQNVVIPNAINIKRLNDIFLSEKLIKKNKIKVSYIARLSEDKGVLSFLDAITVFNTTYPDFLSEIEFEIVGDGPLRELCERCDLENCNYLGPMRNIDVIRYLSTVYCGVNLTYEHNSSGSAGVSNGLLEQMLAGKVLICWDNFIFRQVLDEKSAIFVKENCSRDLADAFYIIATNRQLKHLGNESKKIAHKFSIENHVKKFVRCVDQLNPC